MAGAKIKQRVLIYDDDQTPEIGFDSLIMIMSRTPDNSVYQDLLVHDDKLKALLAIGDCEAPKP